MMAVVRSIELGSLPRWLVREFSDPYSILDLIISLWRRGFGAQAIARRVFGNRVSLEAGKKRIQRLIRLLRERGILKERDGTSHYVLSHKPIDSFSRGIDAPGSIYSRLGRTERLVLEYLELYQYGSPSGIAAYLRNEGYNISRKAVYEVLNRLCRRGYVVKASRGKYRLTTNPWEREVFAENVKVNDKLYIWNKRVEGRPGLLSEVLYRAELMGLYRVAKIELSLPAIDKELDSMARELEKYGWKYTIIYRDQHLDKLKIEHHIFNNKIPLRFAYKLDWLIYFTKLTELTYNTIKKIRETIN